MKEEFGEQAVGMAMQRGCDLAEVFIKRSSGISVESKGGSVEALEASKDFGCGVKLVKGRKLGFAYTTSPEDIEKTVNLALEGAAFTAEDQFLDIPEPGNLTDVDVYDPEAAAADEESMIRNAIFLEEHVLSLDERIEKVRKAEVSVGRGNTSIINSRGVHINYESTYYSGHVTALARDAEDSQVGWGYAGSRRLGCVDLASVAQEAADRSTELLGSRKITPEKVPVILIPSIAVEFLEILSASVLSESVQKKRSFLAGKIGQTVISPILEIIDDGTLSWGTGTRPADDEGVASSKKVVFSEGVLERYLYNTYTAGKDGTESTGNAVRGGFKTLPGVGVSNFFINNGGAGVYREMIGSVQKGMVIVGAMGVHTANPISGDFSVGISGLWIENGAVAYPVKEAVLSGNVLDLFKKVEAVGSDLTFYGSTGSPSLLIGSMDISA